ncbi:MAG: hypothetical protein JRF33_25735 [Deltaproteobacteria bacterium]|nr:hypothetical protein [Deltaproteobacteria bacterium]
MILGCFFLSSCGSDPVSIVEIDGWLLRASFSPDGNRIVVKYDTIRDKQEPEEGVEKVMDSFAVLTAPDWTPVFSYRSPYRIWRTYTCANPDIIIHTEDHYPEDTKSDLVFRSMTTGQEVSRISIDYEPGFPEYNRFHCDIEKDIAYIDAFADRIVAVDGTNGTIITEYITGEPVDYSEFRVQKAQDRLVRIDLQDDNIWIFRLSTGELLQKVELHMDYLSELWRDYDFVNESTLVYANMGERNGHTGTFLFVLDLDSRELVAEHFLGYYYLAGMASMDSEGRNLSVLLEAADRSCWSAWVVDIVTGQSQMGIEPCVLDRGMLIPIPKQSIMIASDWSHPSGATQYFTAYSYPDYQVLAEGPAPSAYDEKIHVPNRKLLVMSSTFNDHFGVYNLDRLELVSDFHVCERLNDVGLGGLSVDPSGRWALMICGGEKPSPLGIGSYPSGAGIALVDLEHYRPAD